MVLPVVTKFRESVKIGGISMEEGEFYVIDSKNEKYDLLLGYKFLSMNGMIIHPDRMMIEKKVNKDGKCQMYVNKVGDVKVKLVKGVEAVSYTHLTLPTSDLV